jgi:hypothetical protein
MALRVVSLKQLKLEMLLEPGCGGDSLAEVCPGRRISRQTYYPYRRRYEAEGASGLFPRRPGHAGLMVDPPIAFATHVRSKFGSTSACSPAGRQPRPRSTISPPSS